jgi:hypothetical protein
MWIDAPQQVIEPPAIVWAGRPTDVCQWVRRYPELLWLAQRDVTATQEGRPAGEASPSVQLFGEQFIEFDRSLLSLRALDWLLDGSDGAYKAWVSPQGETGRLSREDFKQLHEWAVRLNQRHVVEAALVLGDLGKAARVREHMAALGCDALDHDDFYVQMVALLQHWPELSPTFKRLSEEQRALLGAAAGLAHYGHITHLEGGPEIFAGLVGASADAVELSLLVQVCDVAGALGHLVGSGSLAYKEATHRALMATAEACRHVEDPAEAYRQLLAVRAGWLGLDPDKREEWALTRVGAMLRLVDAADGQLLRQAGYGFSEPLARLWYQPECDLNRLAPTYVPALFLNLANNAHLGTTRQERLHWALAIGVPFLREAMALAAPGVRLNFNSIAGIAKDDPWRLVWQWPGVDAEGNVYLQKMDATPKRQDLWQ